MKPRLPVTPLFIAASMHGLATKGVSKNHPQTAARVHRSGKAATLRAQLDRAGAAPSPI